MANDKKRKLRWDRTDKDGKKTFSNAIDGTVYRGGLLGKNHPIGKHEITDKMFQRELAERHAELARLAAEEVAKQRQNV